MKKKLNEDSLSVQADLGLYIVADGMGGHNAGEVASTMAVKIVEQIVREGIEARRDPQEIFNDAVRIANSKILQSSLRNPAWNEMGTTIVMALARDSDVLITHVGDSRAYFIGDGKIKQLTQDHTFVAEWLREGRITKEEARNHRQRHGLIEALGVTEEVENETNTWIWNGFSCLLLCSDGLTDMVEDEDILKTLEASTDPQDACVNLVKLANERGGEDNITVIVVCRE